MIPLHILPADTLFRLYIQNGSETRAVLWFRCSNNGDLVTRPQSKGRQIYEAKGNFDQGYFKGTSALEPIALTGNDEKDHVHMTFHPSVKQPTPVLFGVGRRPSTPLFDLRRLNRLEEIVVHSLASPSHYPIERPRLDKPDGKHHGILNNPYVGGLQPKATFFVAPLKRDNIDISDELIAPG